MAIQFACPACQQPIEVDDEWADQTVSCPYCRRVVRAPAQSTLQIGVIPAASQPANTPADRAPVAPAAMDPTSPLPPPPPRGYASPHGIESPGPMSIPPGPGRNPIATWSVVLGLTAWVLLVLGIGIFVPVVGDVMQPIASTLPSKPTQQQLRQLGHQAQIRFQDALVNDPATRKRAGGAMLLLLAAEVSGLTALILGLVGATRRYANKGAAVAGIIISGVFLSAQCGAITFLPGWGG
jgi:hypothetical protein